MNTDVKQEISLPQIIQGGMGIGISHWKLAREVSLTGQLGVVSGTAIDNVLALRLQNGDFDGLMRKAMQHFPDQKIISRILKKFFIAGGKAKDRPFVAVPKLSVVQNSRSQELLVVSAFVEVWLAKQDHDGQVGINFLHKIQMANGAAILGAIMADVDYILMGAGIPREIPQFIVDLLSGDVAKMVIEVKDAPNPVTVSVYPKDFFGGAKIELKRPKFLAIISSEILASYLVRGEGAHPDGFVIETDQAGGHNAPPRGKLTLDESNEPIYGVRDIANLEKMRTLGLPFWLAGGYGKPEMLTSAIKEGAAGIQVGTLFAMSEDSGFAPHLRSALLAKANNLELAIRTDVKASPTTFPIKIVELENSTSSPEIFAARTKLCDLGYLRSPVQLASGRIDYRCAGEPEGMYVKKGGDLDDTLGRKCLCNGLMANIGLGQHRLSGYDEPPLVTLGSEIDSIADMQVRHNGLWSAKDVVTYLLGKVHMS